MKIHENLSKMKTWGLKHLRKEVNWYNHGIIIHLQSPCTDRHFDRLKFRGNTPPPRARSRRRRLSSRARWTFWSFRLLTFWWFQHWKICQIAPEICKSSSIWGENQEFLKPPFLTHFCRATRNEWTRHPKTRWSICVYIAPVCCKAEGLSLMILIQPHGVEWDGHCSMARTGYHQNADMMYCSKAMCRVNTAGCTLACAAILVDQKITDHERLLLGIMLWNLGPRDISWYFGGFLHQTMFWGDKT